MIYYKINKNKYTLQFASFSEKGIKVLFVNHNKIYW